MPRIITRISGLGAMAPWAKGYQRVILVGNRASCLDFGEEILAKVK